MYILEFDGMLRSSVDGWPVIVGLLGYDWHIQRNSMEVALGFEVFLRRCKTGSNVAEYLALSESLEALADRGIINEMVEVRGDARCVIDQMTGQALVSSPLTRTMHNRARRLSKRFKSLTWVWLPRRENKQADKLSHRSFRYLRYSPALEREIKKPPFIQLYGGKLIPLLDLRVYAPDL